MKHFKTVLALLTALVLIVSGTFALNQVITASNEFIGQKKGDGGEEEPVLHDDFDPKANMKDIYVENLGDTNLYIRIKLSEAMSLTSHTWRPGSNDFTAHTYGAAAEDCGHSNAAGDKFHDYFTWKMGGWKYYKPASGTGDVAGDTTIYTEDDFNNPNMNIEKTPNAKIITAAAFLAMDKAAQKAFIGWIYDTDGYAYWSQALKPTQVTGLLLNGVITSPSLENTDYYYVIDVLVEAVDKADIPMWTEGAQSVDEPKTTLPEATDDGKEVIKIIVGEDDDDSSGGDNGGNGNGGDNGGNDNGGGNPENPGDSDKIKLKTPSNPDLGYQSHITGDRKDESGWFTSPDKLATAELDEPGAFRLEDILADMADADGLKVTPVESKYNGMFSIGSARTKTCPERADVLSILYTVIPDKDVAAAQWAEDTKSLYPITTELLLETADGRTATIKVTMEYRFALIAWEY